MKRPHDDPASQLDEHEARANERDLIGRYVGCISFSYTLQMRQMLLA